MTSGAWRALAACRGLDTDLFFPAVGVNAAEAKAVCAGCPVRGECLDFALGFGTTLRGVFGGLTEKERRRLRRERRQGRAA